MYCNLQQQFSINLELFIVEDCHLLQEKILLREPRLFVLYHNGVSILINICQSIKLSHSDIVFPYLCISGFLVVSKYFRHTTKYYDCCVCGEYIFYLPVVLLLFILLLLFFIKITADVDGDAGGVARNFVFNISIIRGISITEEEKKILTALHLQHLNTYWRQLTLRHFRCLKYRLVWFACLRSTRLRITLDHWHGSLCLHRAPKPISLGSF